GPFPASISACATQLRTADSVRPRSLDRAPMVLSPWRTNPTTSALYSFVNVRLALLPMWTPSGIFAFFGVSTKAGQDQVVVIGRAAFLLRGRNRSRHACDTPQRSPSKNLEVTNGAPFHISHMEPSSVCL